MRLSLRCWIIHGGAFTLGVWALMKPEKNLPPFLFIMEVTRELALMNENGVYNLKAQSVILLEWVI